MKKLLGIVVLGLLLVGCDNNPLNSYFGNTVSRVENCMKNTSSKLVSEEIIKNRCIKKIQEIRQKFNTEVSDFPEVFLFLI